jgi:hypothetical protein
MLDEASREEAAKIGGMAWIVRTALDGLGGFLSYEMPTQLRERIAGDVQAVAYPVVMERLTATGQTANFGGRIPGGDRATARAYRRGRQGPRHRPAPVRAGRVRRDITRAEPSR